MRAALALLLSATLLTSCSGGESSAPTTGPDLITATSTASTVNTAPATTQPPPPTTLLPTTTTTLPPLTDMSPECTILQAAVWLQSDVGSLAELAESERALLELVTALEVTGVYYAELFEQSGTIGVADWLVEQLQTTRVYDAQGDIDSAVALACATSTVASDLTATAEVADLVEALVQHYASRYRLAGAQPSEP